AAERAGGVLVRALVQIDEHQHLPELVRQRGERRAHLVAQALAGDRAAILVPALVALAQADLAEDLALAPAAAVAVDERVDEDAVHPRAAVGAGLKALPERPRAKHGLLHEVLGLRARA